MIPKSKQSIPPPSSAIRTGQGKEACSGSSRNIRDEPRTCVERLDVIEPGT
ncbi:hypothetical protein [Methanofollis aquaemaris]|uniref:hypothetical protein n=1 Tax=Methanofollis aquaemaris TaxID=126734 RepID=UPI00223FB6B9|nr:hypothetical protein [Methanofollis aquaemaris]